MSIVGVGARATGAAFDRDWFGIGEVESSGMHARRRVTLEVAVEALDDSGLGWLARGSNAAVVFGAAAVFGDAAPNGAHQLSRALDLRGPSLLVQSDRLSPLVAVDTAVRLLADESVPFVITGGVDLTLLPRFSGIAVPTDIGLCTVLVLQRTADTHRTGSHRYAEITGAGMGFPAAGAYDTHIALAADPRPAPAARGAQPPLLLPLSARDHDALRELAEHWAERLPAYRSLSEFASGVSRLVPEPVRAAVLAHDIDDARTQLHRLARHLTREPAPADPAGSHAVAGTRAAHDDSHAHGYDAHTGSLGDPHATHTGRLAHAGAHDGTPADPEGTQGGSRAEDDAGEHEPGPGPRFRAAGTGAVLEPVEGARPGGLLWLFAGGGGHPRMGRALAARHPVFAAALTDAADAVVEAGGPRVWTPRNGFASCGPHDDDTQPALFVFQWALAALLRAWSPAPDAVAGYGPGEVAAAAVAGALSLTDAARIAVVRGRLLAKIPERGAAAVVEATLAEVGRLLEPMRADVGVAAIEGARSVTVSGDPRYIDTLVRRAHRRAIFAQRVTPDSPAAQLIPHIPQARALAPHLIPELSRLTPRSPRITFFSTSRPGAVLRPTPPAKVALDAAYWSAGVGAPVDLAGALDTAVREGISTVLEIGPQAVAAGAVREHPRLRDSTYAAGARADEAEAFLRAVGRLYVAGRDIDGTAAGPRLAAPPRRRWRRAHSGRGLAPQVPAVAIRGDGTYVVAGGLGASGAVAVRWLLDAGARDVVVLTRQPRALPPPLDGMEDWIVLVRCDAADRDDLANALHDIRECGSPIRGVVHAGRERDRIATANLVALTASDPTDFAIGFSTAGWEPLSRVSS
ncbi:acyltransferase domain-containing protein [Nocardia sp. NPDC003693]